MQLVSFYTPLKRFSDVFRGNIKKPVTWNVWKQYCKDFIDCFGKIFDTMKSGVEKTESSFFKKENT